MVWRHGETGWVCEGEGVKGDGETGWMWEGVGEMAKRDGCVKERGERRWRNGVGVGERTYGTHCST